MADIREIDVNAELEMIDELAHEAMSLIVTPQTLRCRLDANELAKLAYQIATSMMAERMVVQNAIRDAHERISAIMDDTPIDDEGAN